MCDEESGMELHDETYKMFLNTTGTKSKISSRLRKLLRYMNDTKSYPVKDADDLIKKIEGAVVTAKQNVEWRMGYMIYSLHERDAEKRGEARGKQETIIQSIHNLMESLELTADQAMNALKIPKEEQAKYLSLLKLQ